MAQFYPKFYFKLGESGKNTVYVQDSSNVWQSFNHYEFFEIRKTQNNVSEFEIKIFDIQDNEKTYFKEGAYIMFFSDQTLILKGRIEKIEYGTTYSVTATGFGVEAKIRDIELTQRDNTNATWIDSKRAQWTNISAQTIANEILSQNTDGSSPWIIQPNTDGLFDTDYGNITFRVEYGNRLRSLAELANSIDYEWWVSIDDLDYDIEYFNMKTFQGSVSSVKTYLISGANANAKATLEENDSTNMANFVTLLGYGDGLNQLETYTYSASTVNTTLSADITSTDTTIPLTDASSFSSSGEIRIAKERITYSGKSGNDLTGATRGSSSTTAKAHKSGVYTEEYQSETSPGSGSSIDSNGLKEHTIVDRSIINEQTAELVASRILLERSTPIKRIRVFPYEPQEDIKDVVIGDTITITDAESGIDDDFRIVGIKYRSEYGMLDMELEVSNVSLEFIQQMQREKEKTENMAKYMQGSTNIFTVQETENAENNASPGDASAVGPIDLFFNVPEDAIALNKITLSYRNQPPRTFANTAASGGGQTTSSGGGSTETSAAASSESSSSNSEGNPGSSTSVGTSWTTIWASGLLGVTSLPLALSWLSFEQASTRQLAIRVRYHPFGIGADTFWPSSTGVIYNKNSGDWGDFYTIIPHYFTNGSFRITIEAQWITGSGSNNVIDRGHGVLNFGAHSHDVTIPNHTHTVSNHTHDITYDINEQSYTTTDVRIFTTDDADGTPTWTERTSAVETTLGRSLNSDEGEVENDINLTSFFSGTGWKGVRIAVDGNSRHKVQANVKCFIESKT